MTVCLLPTFSLLFKSNDTSLVIGKPSLYEIEYLANIISDREVPLGPYSHISLKNPSYLPDTALPCLNSAQVKRPLKSPCRIATTLSYIVNHHA